MTLDATVLFGKDSATLCKAAKKQIRAVADDLSELDDGKVGVIGYTDDLGSAEHGLVLSRERAKAVANDSEENRKINRHVEVTITPN